MPRRRRPSAGTRSPSAEDDEVAAHHLAPGDAPMHAVADDERARARQVAQRLERSLGAPLLDDGDGHDHEHEAEQHQRVGRLAHEEVEAPGGDEHEEHRLAGDLEGDGQQAPLLLGRQLVRAFCLQAARASSSLRPARPAGRASRLTPPMFILCRLMSLARLDGTNRVNGLLSGD